MDQPICVVDATTFVDQIQEIKRLVYQDKIRLVVPQSTSASLEIKYEKLTEEGNKKPSRQPEPQRPRSSGKPTKVEHPAVDINPLVAGEFLARLRSKEGQDAVEFQKDSEQYSPWKILELEEESRAASENRPTSFAQAVRKQSMEKFSKAAGATNGPQKPRLVARSAGADGSPWKKSNKALSLPISEVPKETRPLLGCLLWRLHEKGATRWDTDRTVFICNDEKTLALAKRLGIPAKTMAALKKSCDTKGLAAKERETFGDLEKDFGIRETAEASSSRATTKDSVSVSIMPIVDLSNENKLDASCAPEEANSSDRSSFSAEIPAPPHSSTGGFDKEIANVEKPKNASFSKVTENDGQMQEKEDGPPIAPSPDHDHGPLAGAVPDAPIEATAQHDQSADHVSRSNFTTLAVEKENSIAEWVRSLTDAANNSEHGGRDTPMSGRSSAMETAATQSEPLTKFKPLTYLQAVTGRANEANKKAAPPTKKEIVPSPRSSPARDPSPPKLKDPIDSDEEIVVFNPKAKRLSAQKAQQNQQARQNTPSKITPLANGTSHAEIQPAADRSPAVNGHPVAEASPAIQAPTITTPPVVLKPSPLIHGAAAEPAVSGSSPSVNGLQSSPSAPHVRAERPRYSPRGSPRRTPAEPEVGYILKSGQPREATRGRGKLWVP
ncbi:MAG: hypothetical protein Q9196_004937 [Gyalolechia fulgens]